MLARITLWAMLIGGAGYFGYIKSEVDTFSLAFLGGTFYFSPGLAARGAGLEGAYTIPPSAQLFGAVFFATIIVGDILLRRISFGLAGTPSNACVKRQIDRGELQHIVLQLISLGAFLVLFVTYDFSVLGGAKSVATNQIPPFIGRVFFISASLAFVASILLRRWLNSILPITLLLGWTIMFQQLSALAMALGSGILAVAVSRGFTRRERIRYGITGTGVALLFILFDKTKGYILRGRWGYLLEIDTWGPQMFWNTNAQAIFQTLVITFRRGYRIQNPPDYLMASIASGIPFSETLFGIEGRKFGRYVHDTYHPTIPHGFGNQIWGEGYALGGILGLFAALSIFLLISDLLRRGTRQVRFEIRMYSLAISPYLVAFIHRLSLSSVIGYAMDFAVIVVISGALVRVTELAFIGKDRYVSQDPGGGTGEDLNLD